MKTFGIDVIPIDNLLSSHLSNVIRPNPSQSDFSHKISVDYVSGYDSQFNFLSRNNIHVPNISKNDVPGYVSIEGAQMLQQYA
jgi:hypothetical protein